MTAARRILAVRRRSPPGVAWLDYAHELGDADVIAYILMRKSNIASESGQPGHALGLASASLAATAHQLSRVKAVALRQVARAHAMLSEQADFERAVDEALMHANEGDPDDPDNPARYCTPAYVSMEAGLSWLELGHPDRAARIYQRSLDDWPSGSQQRDKGLCLARLATPSLSN